MESHTCPFCGKEFHEGRRPNFTNCIYCEVAVCNDCAQLGLCPDHYEGLTDQQKDMLSRVRGIVTIRIITTLILFPIFVYIFYQMNNNYNWFDFQVRADVYKFGILVGLVYTVVFMGIVFQSRQYNRKNIKRFHD